MKTTNSAEGGCGQHELLVTVLYGEASQAELRTFDEHRRTCRACSEEFATFERTREQLRGWEIGAIPAVKVEVRPSFAARLKQAFTILPMTARIAAAAACALLVLAVANTEFSVGPGGMTFRTGLSRQAAAVAPGSATVHAVSQEDIDRAVAARCDTVVERRIAAYRTEMEAQLTDLQVRLANANGSDDMRKLTIQVSAQKRRIEALQRDLDRTAGFGGTDLFSAVLNDQPSGS